ncbi:MAG TPA: DEAD/DEAH box helicase [Gammaproteobacteria bacterium]|nr:DEAD/DEAH box helicase [Gammaproteobacteria bacterium]
MSFDSLGLSADVLRAVAEQGYSSPTPIQARVIPVVLEGRDVLAGAQTGTGKTAGFALPLLQRLSAAPAPQGRRQIRALILTPTRELAAQVGESVKTYGKYLPLTSAVIFGGVNINPQTALLRRGIDILVATPGRLLDHASQRNVDLRHVEILVLDEADRMLDMGFLPDIKRVLALLPSRRQNLLFSATFPPDIVALANKLLTSPARVEVAPPNATADRIEQLVYFADKAEKRALLSWLIGSNDWRQVLVFTRTKHGANRLTKQLEQDGFAAAAIHGNKSQGARTRALADFKSGAIRVLVATDVAARGIDITELPHVVNYELPDVAEHYVHRIGRTGRAGNEGVAVSLVSGDERPSLKGIERLLGKQLPKAAERPRLANPPRAADPRPQGDHARTDGHRPAAQGERGEHRGGEHRHHGGSHPQQAHRGDGNRERQEQHGRRHGQSRAARRRRAAARAGGRH